MKKRKTILVKQAIFIRRRLKKTQHLMMMVLSIVKI